MKKIGLVFLIVLLMCTLFSTPVFAESWTDKDTGDFYHVIETSSELKDVLENCGHTDKKIHLLLAETQYTDVEPINITTPNHFVFELYKYGSTQITTYDYDRLWDADDRPLIYISESAEGATLEFVDSQILLGGISEDEGGAIYIDADYVTIIGGNFQNCKSIDDDGGAIYVNGENVTIDGSMFWGCYSDGDGGAICVNKDDCTIKNAKFSYCSADSDGGGIYFCVGADDGYVANCIFEGCECDGDGPCVDGYDTLVYIGSGSPSFNEDDYDNCDQGAMLSGSVMSVGNITIIVIILALAIFAVIFIIIKKKKKSVKENTDISNEK